MARTGRSASAQRLLAVIIGMVAAGAASAQETVKMTPKVAIPGTGAFQTDTTPALLATKGAMAEGGAAIQPLADMLSHRFSTRATAAPAGRSLPSTAYVLAGLTNERAAFKDLVKQEGAKLPQHGLGDEGYALEIAPGHILLTAAKPAGLFRGATALAEMAGDQTGALNLPAGQYADWPTMAWRGMHVSASTHADVPAIEALITRYAPQLRMNKLILEMDYGFPFKSHPEMAAADGITPEDCRRLSALARANFVEIIPSINCLGHQSWAKKTGTLLTKHPEFDETPNLPLDNPGIYCRSWCPNTNVAAFVGDLMGELIDAFGAKSFHCGMDEVFILGECDRCKGKDNSDLFAKAVNDLHAQLAKRHVAMMIWGDRLIDAKATGNSEWEASENGTAPAINKIPKDIVLCDWHYGKATEFPSVKVLLDAGFRVWPSGWNSTENARGLAECALRNTQPNMVGYLATTWTGVNAVTAGLSGDETANTGRNGRGLIAGIRTGLGVAWNGQ